MMTQLQLRNIGAISTDMVDDTNPLPVRVISNQSIGSSFATLSSVAGSGSSVTLLTPNPLRTGAIIVNESASTLDIKYGATASLTNYTYSVAPGATWEMPSSLLYSGRIDGIWSSGTGAARITELQP